MRSDHDDAQAQDGFRVPARCGRCVDCRTGGRRSTNRPVATGKQRQTDDRRDAPVASTPKARGAPARRNGCRHAAYLAAPRISRWRGKRIMRTDDRDDRTRVRSDEHTSELQSLMRISYAVYCLKKKRIKSKTKSQSL